MFETKYVFSRELNHDPDAFTERLDELQAEGFQIMTIRMRPKPDGSAWSYARLRRRWAASAWNVVKGLRSA